MVSAVSASSWRGRSARVRLTFDATEHVQRERLVQLARASSVPAGRNSRSIGRGVRGFKLVMVSAVSTTSTAAISGPTTDARTREGLCSLQTLSVTSGAVGERPSDPGEAVGKGGEVSVNLHWWSRRSVQVQIEMMVSGSLKTFRFASRDPSTRCQCASDAKFALFGEQSSPTNLGGAFGDANSFEGAEVSGGRISDGLGGQRFKLAISRRGARARTFNLLAPPQVECDESGAFGEWFKRPWGGAVGKGARGVSKFALVASASTTSIASSVKKRKKERRFSFDRIRKNNNAPVTSEGTSFISVTPDRSCPYVSASHAPISMTRQLQPP